MIRRTMIQRSMIPRTAILQPLRFASSPTRSRGPWRRPQCPGNQTLTRFRFPPAIHPRELPVCHWLAAIIASSVQRTELRCPSEGIRSSCEAPHPPASFSPCGSPDRRKGFIPAHMIITIREQTAQAFPQTQPNPPDVVHEQSSIPTQLTHAGHKSSSLARILT